MSKKVLEIKNLDKWEDWLKSLEQGKVDEMKSRILRTAGLRGLEYVHDLTPRRSGRLQNSFVFGDRENVFKIKVGGKTSWVAYGTVVAYAVCVEEGSTQEAGRFVPGHWGDSGTFHYIKDYSSGMVLKGKIIPGAHMVQTSMDYLEDDLDIITEFEFRRLYADLMGG